MRVLVLMLAVTFLAVPAMAENYEDPLGVGVDLVLCENPVEGVEEVVLETKYDVQNDEASAFLVSRVKAGPILCAAKKGLTGLWSGLTGLASGVKGAACGEC